MFPPPLKGIARVQTLNILGVELTAKYGFSSHIKRLTIKARQSFYALRILRSHRLSGDSLFDVVRATTVGRPMIRGATTVQKLGGPTRMSEWGELRAPKARSCDCRR